MNAQDIIKQAKKEIEDEAFQHAVTEMKFKLRSKKRFFPWRIKIINLNKE